MVGNNPSIERICKQCGKPFKVYPHRIKDGNGNFCSHECAYASRKTIKPTCVCKQCGKTFETKQSYINYGQTPKYCSRECLHESQKKQIETQCPQCGEIFYERPSKLNEVKHKFCSIPCMNAWKSSKMLMDKNPCWRGGLGTFLYCYKFNRRRKHATSNFFGDICILCGKHISQNITKGGKERRLSIHHIYHDINEGCNGKPFNLVPLCMKCHGKEPFYEEEYRNKINKILNDGFTSGKWSREQYEKEVMYSE